MATSMQIDRLLESTVKARASDLFLTVGVEPTIKKDGRLERLPTKQLTAFDTDGLMKGITPESYQIELMEKGSTDFAFDFTGKFRFRVNVHKTERGLGLVLRYLPDAGLKFEDIGLPPTVAEVIKLARGLFPITGPTGSGKTTTLACLVNLIAEKGHRHVITIEDPIEFKFDHLNGLVTQRQVGIHTKDFASGLREALRQAPSVIMVGELRDLETIEVALRAAETGHLVLGTLHTLSAAKTIDRLIEVFPEQKQAQIRTQLSTALKAVLCQQLLRRKDGRGRVAAFELLHVLPSIANLIRDNKTYQIPSVMQTGKRAGMRLLDEHLRDLIRDGIVDAEEAISQSDDPESLRRTLGQ